MASFFAVIERAKARGDMPAARTAADVIAVTLGPLSYRRWFSNEEIEDAFVTKVIENAVGATTRRDAPAPHRRPSLPRNPSSSRKSKD